MRLSLCHLTAKAHFLWNTYVTFSHLQQQNACRGCKTCWLYQPMYLSSRLSFKACTTLGRNSRHQRWIQGGEAVRLQRQIPRLFLLSPGLVSTIWHTRYIITRVAGNAARQRAFWRSFFLSQHVCLPHWDHCVRRSCARVPSHQYRGGRLLRRLPVHPPGLVRGCFFLMFYPHWLFIFSMIIFCSGALL